MTIFKHELKRGKNALLIWTGAISLLLATCILIYPEMSAQMGEVGDLFANMGSFSQAFGMDQLNFGEFIGFFGVECGNVLGLGGSFFAALLGISALAKEEGEHTAEFLLTHPISRAAVVTQKFLAVVVQITVLNGIIIGVTALSMQIIGETADGKTLAWLFFAYYMMQLEIGAITFGISAFVRRSGLGIGLGIAAGSYFLNLIANLVEQTGFLKYVTPFGYTESADIITNRGLNPGYFGAGMVLAGIGVILAFWQYTRKDIA